MEPLRTVRERPVYVGLLAVAAVFLLLLIWYVVGGILDSPPEYPVPPELFAVLAAVFTLAASLWNASREQDRGM